jgi:hypothetical protein
MYTKKLPMAAPLNPAITLISDTRIARIDDMINILNTTETWFFGFETAGNPSAIEAFFNPSLAPFDTNGNPKITLNPVAKRPRNASISFG